MSVQDHLARAGSAPVTFHVVIVSTTRTAATDETGPALAQRIEGAGHRVTGRDLVPDDMDAIRKVLDTLVARPDVQVVVFSGGTGISRRDHTVEAVRPRFDRELPGFGEIFRHLSFADVGAAAFLSRATCGIVDNTVVFLLPGSTSACILALEKLVLPQARHLTWELGKEPPPTVPVVASTPSPVQGVKVLAREIPSPTDAPDPALPPVPGAPKAPREAPGGKDREERVDEGAEEGTGWQGAIAAAGGRLAAGAWVEIPPPFSGIDGARNVLEGAGQRGTVLLPGGVVLPVFGFPDLLRPASKVLLLAPGDPWGLVVALHRYPRQVGLPIRGEDRWLPDAGTQAIRFAEQATGRPPPFEGDLFAIDGGVIYLVRQGKVQSWDGRRARDEGPPRSVLASLLLKWSQR